MVIRVLFLSLALVLSQSGGAIARDGDMSTKTRSQSTASITKLAQSYPDCPKNKPATEPCRCYSGLVYKMCGKGQTCVENAQCVP
jgi:hypothetical protein